MAFRKRVKEVEEEVKTFWKKGNEEEFSEIYPYNNNWDMPIQIGFNVLYGCVSKAKVLISEIELNPEEAIPVNIPIRKGFQRTFFEKHGAGASSIGSDTYIVETGVPLKVEFNSLGEQVIIKRKNGYKMTYVDNMVNIKDYVEPEIWDTLSDDDKLYFSNVNTASLRADLIEYLNTVPRNITPYNTVLFRFSQNYSLFHAIEEPVYVEVPTEQYVNADIVLTIGEKTFNIDKYSVVCTDKNGETMFGFMVKYGFMNDILNVLKEEGWK